MGVHRAQRVIQQVDVGIVVHSPGNTHLPRGGAERWGAERGGGRGEGGGQTGGDNKAKGGGNAHERQDPQGPRQKREGDEPPRGGEGRGGGKRGRSPQNG